MVLQTTRQPDLILEVFDIWQWHWYNATNIMMEAKLYGFCEYYDGSQAMAFT